MNFSSSLLRQLKCVGTIFMVIKILISKMKKRKIKLGINKIVKILFQPKLMFNLQTITKKFHIIKQTKIRAKDKIQIMKKS